MIPLFRRGIRYARRSLAIRRDLGDVWGQGQSLHFYGTALYGSGRFEECIESCRTAVRLLERTGDRWEVNTANWHIAFCHLRRGDLREAVEMARHVHEAGLAIGDHQASGISLGAWGKASSGRVPPELLAAELARLGDDVHTAAEVLQAEGVRLLRAGRPGEAAAVLEDARRRVRAAGMRQEYVAPVPCWLATARRQEAEACSPLAPAERRARIRAARRAARRALRTARSYRNNLAHAHREAGLVAGMRGRTRRARRHLERSLDHAERRGQRHEAALTRAARARLAAARGRPGSASEAAAADRALETALASAAELTPGDGDAFSGDARFDAVLDAGRRIASALAPEAVFAAAEESARALLRGAECVVVEPDAAGGPGPRELMERAIARGRPAVAGPDPAAGRPGGALWAPIFVRDRAAACLGAVRSDPDDPFTAGEVRLAEFVAALAGAALENAAGFGEIAALSRTLERRVEERTTQLAASNVELDASLRKAEALLESLSEGVVACDSAGRLTLFNRASREFHGIFEAVPAERWPERYDLYLADGVTPMPVDAVPLMRALRGEAVRDVEMVIRPPGRPTRVVLASGRQIVDRNGEVLGAVAAMHDITERKRAQLALEEATRHLGSILEAAGEGICGLDADGAITYANPAAARLTGYRVDELIGRDLEARLRAPDEGGEPRYRRRDGTVFAVDEVRTGADEAGGTGVVVFRDVSERRALERMKDEFVALASHELRTPLTSVLGYLESVLDGQGGDLTEDQERLLGVADRNAKRLARLVNDVLTVAQSDAGRLALDLRQIDLAPLIAECAEGARPAARERGIHVRAEVGAIPPVLADRARLAQVLDNLVSNALKFTPPGGRVTVRARTEADEVVLEVSDTGIGIPAVEQRRLFTRFYRASSAVEAAIPGTGLGLAITAMIVERHGGRVGVESAEGAGSTFRVVLPAAARGELG
jgi:signal transduction histidine kinase/tetratricopeptide (TPR) repeat protein